MEKVGGNKAQRVESLERLATCSDRRGAEPQWRVLGGRHWTERSSERENCRERAKEGMTKKVLLLDPIGHVGTTAREGGTRRERLGGRVVRKNFDRVHGPRTDKFGAFAGCYVKVGKIDARWKIDTGGEKRRFHKKDDSGKIVN